MRSALKPPIILIGNHRSGTTVTQNLIGLHPEVVTWYEPRTLWRCADPRRPDDEFDERDAQDRIVRYVRERFRKFQVREGDRRIVEKTPSNVLRVRYVERIFPDATYLFITRNPFSYTSSMDLKWTKTKTWAGLRRTIAATPATQLHLYAKDFVQHFITKSVLRQKSRHVFGPRYRGIDRDMETCSRMTVIARQWARGNRMAREDLGRLGPGRVLAFRYEDLIEAPESTLQRVFDHCRLDCTDEILAAARKMVDPGRQRKWLRLDREALRGIVPELEDEMARYGYEVPRQLLEPADDVTTDDEPRPHGAAGPAALA